MGATMSSVEAVNSFFADPRKNQVALLPDGSKISYAEHGNAAGFPVFFFPGISGCRFLISAFQSAVRDSRRDVNDQKFDPSSKVYKSDDDFRIRLFAIDYPGYGKTTLAPKRSLEQFRAVFAQFVDRVLSKDQKFGLIGHSAGGLHAAAVATCPSMKERISCMVLLAPWCSTKTDGTSLQNAFASYAPSFLIKSIANTSLWATLAILKNGTIDTFCKLLSTTEANLLKSWNISPEAWQAYVNLVSLTTSYEGFSETFMLCTETHHKFNGLMDLNRTNKECRVKILVGDKDHMASDTVARKFYMNNLSDDTLKRVDFEIVPDSTHDGIPLTHADQTIDFIIKNMQV